MNINFFIEDLKYKGNITIGKMIEIGRISPSLTLAQIMKSLMKILNILADLIDILQKKLNIISLLHLVKKE